jgi:hypothetical protein
MLSDTALRWFPAPAGRGEYESPAALAARVVSDNEAYIRIWPSSEGYGRGGLGIVPSDTPIPIARIEIRFASRGCSTDYNSVSWPKAKAEVDLRGTPECTGKGRALGALTRKSPDVRNSRSGLACRSRSSATEGSHACRLTWRCRCRTRTGLKRLAHFVCSPHFIRRSQQNASSLDGSHASAVNGHVLPISLQQVCCMAAHAKISRSSR